MEIVGWILQILLAAAFVAAGGMKLARPRSALAAQGMGFVDDLSDTQVKGIGACEVLAAIGLILPWALDIVPVLTPLAAVGLVIVMAGAIVVQNRRGEQLVPPLVLGVLAVVTAIIRFATL